MTNQLTISHLSTALNKKEQFSQLSIHKRVMRLNYHGTKCFGKNERPVCVVNYALILEKRNKISKGKRQKIALLMHEHL